MFGERTIRKESHGQLSDTLEGRSRHLRAHVVLPTVGRNEVQLMRRSRAGPKGMG